MVRHAILRSLPLRLYAACRDVLRGAVGADGYAAYRTHIARHHPDERPLSHEAYFRREFSARWEGIRRCC